MNSHAKVVSYQKVMSPYAYIAHVRMAHLSSPNIIHQQ